MEATSGVGYARLHGRNYTAWFSQKADVREGYDYLYSVQELERGWLASEKSRKTKGTYVVSNNHNVGKAAVNSLQLAAILPGEPVPAPSTLVQHYSQLEGYVKTRG